MPTFVLTSFSNHFSNFFVTEPSAPITTGTTFNDFISQILSISLFRSWYFSTFSISFSLHHTSAGTAISKIEHLFSFFSTSRMSGFLLVNSLRHFSHQLAPYFLLMPLSLNFLFSSALKGPLFNSTFCFQCSSHPYTCSPWLVCSVSEALGPKPWDLGTKEFD